MRFSSSIASLAGALFIASTAVRAQTWVGCGLTASISSAASAQYGAQGARISQSQCITTCTSAGYPYAAWVDRSVSLTGYSCYCLNEANYISASGYAGLTSSITTSCVITVQATIYYSTSTFSYDACYLPSAILSDITGTLGTEVGTPAECFSLCASNEIAFFIPYVLSLSPHYGCVCGTEDDTLIASPCGQGNFYAYSHSAEAAASALPRRKRNYERLMARKRSIMIKERAWDCPTGMRACNVDGVAESWECIDPTNDLESCGGCTYGDFSTGANTSVATGFDCTALPGILRGSVTCSAGRCEAFACKRGWTLRDGECTRSLTIQI